MMAAAGNDDIFKAKFSRVHTVSTGSDVLRDDDPPMYGEIFDRTSKIEFMGNNNNNDFSKPTEESSVIPKESWPMTEEEIRMEVAKYVAVRPFLASSHIQSMEYQSVIQKSAYHYQLETFTEQRETFSVEEPFKENTKRGIDGPDSGLAPNAWDISVHPSSEFESGKKEVKIPHTEVVSTCTRCTGKGNNTCSTCAGTGKRTCSSCKGTGSDKKSSKGVKCSSCTGSGNFNCFECHRSGKVECTKCKGCGKILIYQKLKVTWEVTKDNFVSGGNGLKDHDLMAATGSLIVNDLDKRVSPLKNFPDANIEEISQETVKRHLADQLKRVLKQRQIVRCIPVIIVEYAFQKHRGKFLIYGEDRRVYFEKYPAACVIL